MRSGAVFDRAAAIAQERGTTISAVINAALVAYVTEHDALAAAGIDTETTTRPPDEVTVTAGGGAWFCIGYDGADETGTQRWTGTRYSAGGDIEGTEAWTSLESMAAAVAAWAA